MVFVYVAVLMLQPAASRHLLEGKLACMLPVSDRQQIHHLQHVLPAQETARFAFVLPLQVPAT